MHKELTFSVDLKLQMDGKDVPLKKFAFEFLTDAMRSVIAQAPAQIPALTRQTANLGVSTSSERRDLSPKLLSITEAARLLGLRPPTIRRYVAVRKISSVRIGRRVLIPTEAIDRLISHGMIPAEPDQRWR